MTKSSYNYINLEYMDLMADGDLDMKKTMLEMLLDELPTEVQKVVDLCQVHDMKTLKAVSHKLKSTLAFVGYDIMDNTNKEIERIAIDNEETSNLSVLASGMETYCKQVMTELEAEFNKL